MNTRERSTRNNGLAILACLVGIAFFESGLMARAYAGQSKAGESASQEFLDSIRKGDLPKVKELFKQDPSLAKAATKNGTTPILLAVYANQTAIAEFLLASGIEPNIFEAAATGRVDRVRELLKVNPQLISAYSPDGWTALHLNFGHLDVAALLVERGADINAVSKNKFTATPLQGAAVTNRIDIARLLISHGANVSPRGEGGASPLHEAAGSGELEFARMLLDAGANVNAKDDEGKTPLTIALEYKKPEVATLLREHGATQ